MTLIDRHILREWLGILGLVLAAVLGLLVMHSLYDELDDLLRLGADVGEVASYCMVKTPGFLATLLPLCLLVSLLYALGKLHHGNEITAMRAAGAGAVSHNAFGLGGGAGFLRARVVAEFDGGAVVGRGDAAHVGDTASETGAGGAGGGQSRGAHGGDL